jgi:polygalacturonase
LPPGHRRRSLIEDRPSINVHLVYCDDVPVEGIRTVQRRAARSTEGVVVDSSKRVRIIACSLSGGADCVSIKSGYNEDGRRVGLPSEDILVSGCHLFHTGGSGVAIGSEASGGVRNVVVEGCVIQDCMTGVHYRSPRGRGGVVENIRVSNVVIDRAVKAGIKISNFWDSVRMDGPSASGSPRDARIRRRRGPASCPSTRGRPPSASSSSLASPWGGCPAPR